MRKQIIAFFTFFILTVLCAAQNVDSLWTVYHNEKNPDSTRFQAFNDIAWTFLYSNPDSTYLLGQEELERARAKKLKKWESKALNTIGASFQIKGAYLKAIDYYQQSLKIREQMGDKYEIAVSMANIGSIYINIGDFKKALNYQLKGLKIFIEIKNNSGKASALNNIGIIYNNMADYYKALAYSMNSLKTYEEIGDQQGVATANGNIGNIYQSMGEYSMALIYQMKSLKIAEEVGDVVSASTIRSTIGRSYMKQKNYPLALLYTLKAKEISVKNGDITSEREATDVLYETYKAMHDPSKALENYERFIVLRDSILKEENQREITRKEIQFDYDKKMAADSVKHSEDQKVKDALIVAKNAQIASDKTQKWALLLGVLLLLISGGVMYNRFRIIRRQKNIIEIKNKETEEQKLIIEEKQKEILSSISYAQRLQEAILPPQKLISKYLPDSFIYYRPKDIVAGDFYWLEIVNSESDELVLFAAADCTGHGVPGAMVSVVCSNALNRTVKEFGITEPGKILDSVLELVVETFERSENEVNDGMDISICAYNKKTNQLQWAGANNPLWIIRRNELIEYKPTKQAIGKADNIQPFITHNIQLQKNDMLYLFTDGYADQFGGIKGKKFNYAQLKELFQEIVGLSLPDQRKRVEDNLNQWKAELEQIDDILVMGVKL